VGKYSCPFCLRKEKAYSGKKNTVHQVRNTMKCVTDKDHKLFCADLKTIYQAQNEEKALKDI